MDSTGSGHGLVARSCGRRNEPSCFIKDGKFLSEMISCSGRISFQEVRMPCIEIITSSLTIFTRNPFTKLKPYYPSCQEN